MIDSKSLRIFGTGAKRKTFCNAVRRQVFGQSQFTDDVPESSTWAMMILGFGGLGFIAHRLKQNGAALSLNTGPFSATEGPPSDGFLFMLSDSIIEFEIRPAVFLNRSV
jgi:hypothetical protein